MPFTLCAKFASTDPCSPWISKCNIPKPFLVLVFAQPLQQMEKLLTLQHEFLKSRKMNLSRKASLGRNLDDIVSSTIPLIHAFKIVKSYYNKIATATITDAFMRPTNVGPFQEIPVDVLPPMLSFNTSACEITALFRNMIKFKWRWPSLRGSSLSQAASAPHSCGECFFPK